MSLIKEKKDIFNANFEVKEGICFLNTNWELIPPERILITEGCACHSTFESSSGH